MIPVMSIANISVVLQVEIPPETAAMVSEIVIGTTVFKRYETGEQALERVSTPIVRHVAAMAGTVTSRVRGCLCEKVPCPLTPDQHEVKPSSGKRMVESKCRTCLLTFTYPWRTGPKRKYCELCVKAGKNHPQDGRAARVETERKKPLPRTFGARGGNTDIDVKSSNRVQHLLEEAAANERREL
jgi:hypothetical protein